MYFPNNYQHFSPGIELSLYSFKTTVVRVKNSNEERDEKAEMNS